MGEEGGERLDGRVQVSAGATSSGKGVQVSGMRRECKKGGCVTMW
eukprot:contig_19604_g4824